MSAHPNAVAPSSHSAWLPTHAPPLSSVHNPDVRASNTVFAFADLLHVLIAATQYMPVVSAPVHSALPQMQGAALLGADPSVFVQAGAVRVHMHVRKVEQDVVEEVSVLNHTEPDL